MTKIKADPLTACKQYCLAAGATQGNIAYTQNVKLSKNLLFTNIFIVNNLTIQKKIG